ncbi:MAG: DeoR/GlpR family DNA-binding transcription regulator [Lactobacillus sp.]|jgi:DeoR/GlpR family transcriptional regulator of sugar metabolism|nr:DeoR/GlpR family DNA-binding transcription regulator [Lactobacillus sp.]MCI2032299.1 DeoR/GlpR family DNA-binding transcription regulator [Lactobacillus sp.]
MDATARRAAIVEILQENSSVKILELSERLNVTRETIRKDLYELEKKDIVTLVRGGAVLNEEINETDYELRLHRNQHAKSAIADEVMTYIEEGDTVYLDYGTTSLAVAKKIKRIKNITVVTNSIPIINELYKCDYIRLIVLGGEVRRNEGSLFGSTGAELLKTLSINVGFFSGSGLTMKFGLVNHHIGEAQMSRIAADRCQRIVVGVEHEKFGSVYLSRIMPVKQMDVLITDQLTDPQLLEELQSQTKLVLVNANRLTD